MHAVVTRWKAALADAMTVRRTAARVILFRPDDRVLLFRTGDPMRPAEPVYWYLPGGGMQRRETPEQAVRRELREETGIEEVELGPVVLHLCGVRFRYGGWQFEQDEWHLVGRVTDDRVHLVRQGDAEASAVAGHRWWAMDELLASDETIHPWELGGIVERILRDGPPSIPWELPDASPAQHDRLTGGDAHGRSGSRVRGGVGVGVDGSRRVPRAPR